MFWNVIVVNHLPGQSEKNSKENKKKIWDGNFIAEFSLAPLSPHLFLSDKILFFFKNILIINSEEDLHPWGPHELALHMEILYIRKC